jgi:hypothetical protein
MENFRVINIVRLHFVTESQNLWIGSFQKLNVKNKYLHFVNVGFLHKSFEAVDLIQMNINNVFDHLNSAFETFLEKLGLLFRKLLLIIAQGIDHSSELFELLIGSNIVIFEALNGHLPIYLITAVLCNHLFEEVCLIITFVNIVILVNILSILLYLKHPKNALDDCSPKQVNTNEHKHRNKHKESLFVIKPPLEKSSSIFSLRLVIVRGSVSSWSHQPFVGEHEQCHNQMGQDSPFYHAYCS